MTHYDTLGLPRSATPDQIALAYRKLAVQFHPDKNPSETAATKMKQINAAYEILSDPIKKSHYDLRLPKINLAPPRPKTKPKPMNEKDRMEWIAANDPNRGRIINAPSPKFDLWGKPIQQSKKEFFDVFANSYENGGQPYIR